MSAAYGRITRTLFVNKPGQGLWAVADGMGGLEKGERASGLVKSRLEALDLPQDLSVCTAMVCNALESANAELREVADGGVSGTTVVVLIVRGAQFACVWAGDSRLYRLRDGRLDRLSKDHSVVEQLVSAGAVRAEDAMRHPLANRITRAIGTERSVNLEVIDGAVLEGDRYLLCSDGLHGLIAREEIEALAGDGVPAEVAESMVHAALAAGGKDNVSVVLVDIRATG